MKVYTVTTTKVETGAVASEFRASNFTVQAILVGEEGRGRSLGVLPVEGLTAAQCPHVGDPETTPKDGYFGRCATCGIKWSEGNVPKVAHPISHLPSRVENATVAASRAGKPKLVVSSETTADAAIVVMMLQPGYRGGASMTGERKGKDSAGNGIFGPFPGNVLVTGEVAQGDAGRMGGCEQTVFTISAGVVFRTHRTGRLYDAPAFHYYVFTGEELLVATPQERDLLPDNHPLAWPASEVSC